MGFREAATPPTPAPRSRAATRKGTPSSTATSLPQTLLIVARPRLLVLDEPFSGLDPLNQTMFKDLLAAVSAKGRTIWKRGFR